MKRVGSAATGLSGQGVESRNHVRDAVGWVQAFEQRRALFFGNIPRYITVFLLSWP